MGENLRQAELDLCEDQIRVALPAIHSCHGHFLTVGTALATIKAKQLHREAGFRAFAPYCQKVWDISPRRSRQLRAAAEFAATRPKGQGFKNERQAREAATQERIKTAAAAAFGELPAEEQKQRVEEAASEARARTKIRQEKDRIAAAQKACDVLRVKITALDDCEAMLEMVDSINEMLTARAG